MANFLPYNFQKGPMAFEMIELQTNCIGDANLAGIFETPQEWVFQNFFGILKVCLKFIAANKLTWLCGRSSRD
jgi:hypothetical protein